MAVALTAMAVAAPSAVALPSNPLPATYQTWTNDSDGWAEHSGQVQGDGDGVLDVVVASAHRPGGYTYYAGGNPLVLLRGAAAAEQVYTDPAALRVLNGRTGAPLWVHEWSAPVAGPSGRPLPFHFVEGMVTGALDSTAGDDILVLRTVYEPGPAGDPGLWTQVTTLYDAATGDVRWEDRFQLPEDRFVLRTVAPVRSGERVLAAMGTYTFVHPTQVMPHRSEFDVDVVTVGADRLERIADISVTDGVFGAVEATATPDGVTVFTSTWDNRDPEQFDEAGVLTATHVSLSQPATPRNLWTRPGLASASTQMIGGKMPALVVSRDNGTFALEPGTGAQRWRHDAAGLTFDYAGSVGEGDVNGDGIHDVVVSPVLGSSLYREDFTTEIYVLDGERGTVMWSKLEPTGKFGARAYTVLDFDGDGRQEIAAAMLQHDGHPFVGTFSDDPAQMVVYDLADGDRRCGFPLDRIPSRLDSGRLRSDGPDNQILSMGQSGVTTAYGYRLGLCDPL